jgi:uncharacterized membrane protein YciS (DUF1049 family)
LLPSSLKSSLFLLVDMSLIEPMGSSGESITLTFLVCVYGGPFSFSWFLGWVHWVGLAWAWVLLLFLFFVFCLYAYGMKNRMPRRQRKIGSVCLVI